MFFRVAGDVGGAILAVRIDCQELHAVLCKFLAQLGQARQVGVVDRALRAQENHGNRLLVSML
jgi:hypothetical protein